MSKIGFGTYRITSANPQHIEALKSAILNGVRLIDTSTNYMDGDSHKAIATTMSLLEDSIRDEILVVSKLGYIQNSILQKHKQRPFDGVHEIQDSLYYSISPSFVDDQIKTTLKELELNQIESMLLHNPEYILIHAKNRGVDINEAHESFEKELFEAFLALEKAVSNGDICSYGVSSNSFSIDDRAYEYIGVDEIVSIANKAALASSRVKSALKYIEMPMNILESNGLANIRVAKEHNLVVLVNRPLNAQKSNQMYRLADYEKPYEYERYLNELLEVCDTKELQTIFNLVNQLDENKHKFGWIGDYEYFLINQVMPTISLELQKLDPHAAQLLIDMIDNFLSEYKNEVAYECSRRVRYEIKDELEGFDLTLPLQEIALKELASNGDIDYILVGMRKPSYVSEVVSILSQQ